jgi:hypothetical protein
VAVADKEIASLLSGGDRDGAVAHMTKFSADIGDALLKDWFAFFGELFVKYRDGFVTTPAPAVPVCGCNTASQGYDDAWYERIVAENGDRYLVPAEEAAKRDPRYNHGRKSIAKKDVTGVMM